jgi:anti-sigma B factor antagonist
MNGNGEERDAEPELVIAVERCGSHTVVLVAGEIDLATRDQLRECLAPLHGDVVVDLSRVTFLDSSGIATIVAQAARLADDGATLKLRRANVIVARVLHITGLDDLLVE